MRLLSIDIETTGLNPNTCQTIEIAAVSFDPLSKDHEDLHTFETLVKHDSYQGESYAIAMNHKIFGELASGKGQPAWEAVNNLWCWIQDVHKEFPLTIVGKNFAAFDLQFLKRLSGWSAIPVSHRFLDVGSLYFDPRIHDRVPGTDECCEIAGINSKTNHRALWDALLVADLVCDYYKKKV